MANILLVTDLFLRPERTGIDVYFDKLVYWLPRLAPDWNFTVVSFGEPDVQTPSFAQNLRHRGIPISRRRFHLASTLGFGTPLQTMLEQADLTHLMLPLPVASRGLLLATIHDLSSLLFPASYSWSNRFMTRLTLRRLANHPVHFDVVSDRTGEDLHELFQVPMERIHRIYEGVGEEFSATIDAERMEKTRTKYGLPDRFFLFVGSMHKRKNLPTLLRAYRRFRSDDSTDVRLVVAGRMDLGGKELTQQIEELGLEAQVSLPGYIAGVDLPAVVCRSEALLYPSLYEGFGFPPLEAMACGTPVIASQAGSIPEVTGGHALLCEPLDVNRLASAMSEIIHDAALRYKLVQGGLTWVERFSWKSTAAETLQLYARMLDGHL